MASDLSNIVKSEIINTLENLLSITVTVDNVELVTADDLEEQQCIKVDTDFNFSGSNTSWNFMIPTLTATKFEYLMLGGVTDLKDEIDDEISDAVKEIISTICGSITTSINAQGFADVSDVKFELGSSTVINCTDLDSVDSVYKFYITMNDEPLSIIIGFDQASKPHIEQLTIATSDDFSAESAPAVVQSESNSLLSSILGEDSVENLRLLFDIKLRLSVRLGTKICLLRDVISWDIGEIIELSQMTNEPLDILVNGVIVGQGEAVIVDGKFGVKIKHIGEPKLN